jgi:lipopolysaccharide/colanic/teichoic acid biosynthesis glycosyltransferase
MGFSSLWVSANDLGGVLGLEVKQHLLMPMPRRIKRGMDILFGLPLLLLSIPIVIIFALWIALSSKGSPFYAQVREGFGGKAIRVWKLRTMYEDAEIRLEQHLQEHLEARQEWENTFKLKDDPRVLPSVGKILRKYSLDELPQFWNVLVGDMSLVGPRPFPNYHLQQFPASFRELRYSTPPGITGFWQISARSDSDLQAQEALDTYYVRNWSPWLDIYLMCRTPLAVIAGKGAY